MNIHQTDPVKKKNIENVNDLVENRESVISASGN